MFGQSKKSLSCWILICSVLICAASYGQTPAPTVTSDRPKPQATKAPKKADADQRGTEQSPLVIKILPPTENQEPPATAKDQHESDTAHWLWKQRLDHWPEILLAVFTLGLWIATWQLVRTTKNTAKRQLRAYIFLEGADQLFTDTDEGIDIHMRLKNVGQTPVYKLNYWIGSDIRPFPSTQPFQIGEFTPRNIYIPPGAEIQMRNTWRTPWRMNLLDTDDGSDMRLYVWGEIRYRDAFNKRHFMTFRFNRPRQAGAILEYCEEGNDAD